MDSETNGRRSSGQKVADDLRELVGLEIELAKVELATKTRNAALGVGLFGAAALGAVLLVATLVTAAILALALVLPSWAAALLVAALLALLTGACLLIGSKLLRSAVPPAPRQAIETTKENVDWLRTRLKSVRK